MEQGLSTLTPEKLEVYATSPNIHPSILFISHFSTKKFTLQLAVNYLAQYGLMKVAFQHFRQGSYQPDLERIAPSSY